MSPVPVVLVNGISGAGLSAFDRGLMYGDGVFRTLRIRGGQALWWDAQLARLAADAARLGMACPDPGLWRDDLDAVLRDSPGEAAVKLVLTRGIGQRGYLPAAGSEVTRIVGASPLPDWALQDPEAGLTLRICELALAEQPALAGIKHLNRLENVLARMEWSDPGIHEGLLRDAAGRLIGGVSSNLFLYRAGVLRTPDLGRCGVAGVTRSRLIDRAGRIGVKVEVCDLGLDDLYAAEEAMICNSLIGLRRIARLDGQAWPEPVVSIRLRGLLDD